MPSILGIGNGILFLPNAPGAGGGGVACLILTESGDECLTELTADFMLLETSSCSGVIPPAGLSVDSTLVLVDSTLVTVDET